jgi:hypothetical protein
MYLRIYKIYSSTLKMETACSSDRLIFPRNYKASRICTEGDHRLPRNTGTNLLNYTAPMCCIDTLIILCQSTRSHNSFLHRFPHIFQASSGIIVNAYGTSHIKSSSQSDLERYVIVRKSLDSIFNIMMRAQMWTRRDFTSVRLPTLGVT